MSDEAYIITPELAEAGCVSYWRLSGAVDLGKLRSAWQDAGLDSQLLPASPSPETALRRSVSDLRAKRRLVRPLARRGAWAIVDERVDKGTNTIDWHVTCRVTLAGGRVVIEPATHDLYDKVHTGYRQHLAELAPEDVSAWLVSLASREKAAALRDTGGVYFVPRPSMDFWRRATDAIRAASNHKIFRIPAMKNAEAVEAILDAVTEEAGRETAIMEAELLETGDDALGLRAIDTRSARCAEVLEKVAAYEELLGVKMDTVRQRVEDLRAGLAAAALMASAGGGEEVAA